MRRSPSLQNLARPEREVVQRAFHDDIHFGGARPDRVFEPRPGIPGTLPGSIPPVQQQRPVQRPPQQQQWNPPPQYMMQGQPPSQWVGLADDDFLDMPEPSTTPIPAFVPPASSAPPLPPRRQSP